MKKIITGIYQHYFEDMKLIISSNSSLMNPLTINCLPLAKETGPGRALKSLKVLEFHYIFSRPLNMLEFLNSLECPCIFAIFQIVLECAIENGNLCI